MTTALPAPQLLEIAGVDAVAFAHAQFCNDVKALASGHWQWNAWLSPHGRVRFFFILLRVGEDRLQLLLRGGDSEVMRMALAPFVFRAKISIRTITGTHAYGCNENEARAALHAVPHGNLISRTDTDVGLRLPGPSPRWLLLTTREPATTNESPFDEALNAWRCEDIRAGMVEITPALEDQWLPQWLGLGPLHAVSVTKGCYPGQEIMARLHFKGGNKRGLYRLAWDSDSLPAPGTSLFTAGGAEVGSIVMAVWTAGGRVEALAVLTDSAATSTLHATATIVADIKVISAFT